MMVSAGLSKPSITRQAAIDAVERAYRQGGHDDGACGLPIIPVPGYAPVLQHWSCPK